MGVCSEVIFPRFYDCVMDKPIWGSTGRSSWPVLTGRFLRSALRRGSICRICRKSETTESGVRLHHRDTEVTEKTPWQLPL